MLRLSAIVYTAFAALCVCFGILQTACHRHANSSVTTSAAIDTLVLERTSCFGRCPVYEFTITSDGKAHLNGVAYYDKVGIYEKQFKAAETAAVFEAFAKSNFFTWKDVYTAPISDMPTVYLTFATKGKHKRIKDYYSPPAELTALEKLLTALVDSKGGWTKTGEIMR